MAEAETAALVRDPLRLAIPDPLVEALWEETGGHPLLLQAVMERAVKLGPEVADRIHEALDDIARRHLAATIFPIWWDNLTLRGQAAYRTVLGQRRPLERHEWAKALGNGPDALVEILETTGVLRADGGQILPRCALFRRWLELNQPFEEEAASVRPTRADAPLDRIGARAFEHLVIDSVTRWARATVEFPTWHLRSAPATGNKRLLPEQHFQLGLLTALRQHELLAEPEPLSSARGRADIKVRLPADLTQRACIEVKSWDGTGYKDVVEQVLGYAVPGDEFACVVMVDRQARPLRDRYHDECLRGGAFGDLLWPSGASSAPGGSYPAFVTRHLMSWGGHIRIHHFLVQLPPDGAP